MSTWCACMDSASAVDEQTWASVRSTSHISASEAPPPPSSAETDAEKNRRRRSSAKLSATNVSSASWPAARAAKAGASSLAIPTQSIRETGLVGTVPADVILPLLDGNNGRLPRVRQDQKMDLPDPGRVPRVGAMKGYGQFCPVAVACEIFAERWTPLILRELFSGSRRFGEIRSGMPLISRTLLSQRLRDLEDAGVPA
jgi:hypothetical protein